MIIKEQDESIILHITLEEMFFIYLFLREEMNDDTDVKLLEQGCDLHDYNVVEITFSEYINDEERLEDRNNLVNFIRSLPQESNFGGIREDEYWISLRDVGYDVTKIENFKYNYKQ